MSFEEGDLDMQPLSKVRRGADVSLGVDDVMASRLKVALKIAECIAKWAEIESSLGLFLALLLNADQKAILGMYEAVESSSARLRMAIDIEREPAFAHPSAYMGVDDARGPRRLCFSLCFLHPSFSR
jgi:hypothetical protein